ncbi:hypothetical protein J3Q64DRAFT_1766706 [Phycomyces blakesleeanus]|uniref:Transcription activator GCR1-like domain-containing protein n=1 Tax=Phycomyces blakesleeanus TaxID=4837 RepID=A0ABR3AQU9_PHYBL
MQDQPFIVGQTSVEDISSWTSDQVSQFFDKYNIAYDKSSSDSLLDTVRQYKTAAESTAKLFGDKVDKLLDGIKINLKKNKNISEANADALINTLQHELRQLELHGALAGDQLQEHLDQIQAKVLKQKYLTAAEWQTVASEIKHGLTNTHPTWYQKFFGQPTKKAQETYWDDSFQHWLAGIYKRLESNQKLTKAQLESIGQAVKSALTTGEVTRIGDDRWWNSLQRSVEQQSKLSTDQAKAALDSIRSDVNAYKIFAVDYAGKGYDQSQEFINMASDKLKQSGYLTQSTVNGLFERLRQLVVGPPNQAALASAASASASKSASGAFASIKSVASSVSADWEASSRSAAASRTAAANYNSAASYAASATDAAGSYVQHATNAAGSLADEANRSIGSVVGAAGNAAHQATDAAGRAAYAASASAASAAGYATDAAGYAAYVAAESAASAANHATNAAESAANAASASAASAANYATDAAGRAVYDASASASSLHAQVTDTTEGWKQSFANYWHQKERNTWRKIGYTEAQLDWIQNTLTQSIRDRKSLARNHVADVLAAIRNYLHKAKVQSTSQIDQQMSKLERLFDVWSASTRDEL